MARHLIASHRTIQAIKPGDARKRLNDGDGLYLLPISAAAVNPDR